MARFTEKDVAKAIDGLDDNWKRALLSAGVLFIIAGFVGYFGILWLKIEHGDVAAVRVIVVPMVVLSVTSLIGWIVWRRFDAVLTLVFCAGAALGGMMRWTGAI